jgi:hypothetical protein
LDNSSAFWIDLGFYDNCILTALGLPMIESRYFPVRKSQAVKQSLHPIIGSSD